MLVPDLSRIVESCRRLCLDSILSGIKLIKKYLFKELCKRDESPSFTVKKVGKYPCIKSEFEIFRHYNSWLLDTI